MMLRSLEAIIAIIILTTFVIIFYSSRNIFPEFEIISLKMRAFNALRVLDEKNLLRPYVLANNSNGLKNILANNFLQDVNFEVAFCEIECPKPSVESYKLTSVSYLISGDIGIFVPKQIVLFLW